MDVNGDWLTVQQAARAINISGETVIRSLEQGKIKGLRTGETWLVSRASVTHYAQDPAKTLELPLTTGDFECAACGHIMAHCTCG